MHRAIHTIIALAAVGAMTTGCVPTRSGHGGGDVQQTELALLTSDDTGAWDIAVVDMSGDIQHWVDSNLTQPVSMAHHPDGFFLVSDGMNIDRVDMDGEVSRFNQDPMPSVVYRMNITDDGDVTVAEEYDVTRLDKDGNIVAHTTVPDFDYCWMDAAPGTSPQSGDALLDIFGPTIATWDAESGAFEPLAEGIGDSLTILGVDGAGDYYAAAEWDSRIWTVDQDGNADMVGSLSSMGVPAHGVRALESAGTHSVYALYDGSDGSGIVEVDSDGTTREVMVAEDALWLDMVIF